MDFVCLFFGRGLKAEFVVQLGTNYVCSTLYGAPRRVVSYVLGRERIRTEQ